MSVWAEIRDALAGDIAAGRYPPGTRLPGEMALARRFGVNRHTVRRSVAALCEAGLVRVRRGAGATVTAPPLDYPVGAQTRFTRNVEAAGRAPGRRLLRLETRAADAEEAHRLLIDIGAPLAVLEVVGTADGVPISLGRNLFPSERLPGIAEALAERLAARGESTTDESIALAAETGGARANGTEDTGSAQRGVAQGAITAALQAIGCGAYARRETRISAWSADARLARLLMVPEGAALLVSEGLDADAAGNPINASRAIFAGERVSLTIAPWQGRAAPGADCGP
ncbi:MAG: UTRA domain-containing protein [Pseudomonadota bacterium]